MKKLYQSLFIIVVFIFVNNLQAQVIVTSPTGTGAPSASYSTLADAVTAINSGVIHTGTITCSVNAGHIETAPAEGITLTATGTATNPITFIKNGTGTNPVINAGTIVGVPVVGIRYGIFKLAGSDYVTIDGLTFADNSSTTAPAMEFGVGLFKVDGTNGANNNTIVNCVLNMRNFYGGSGIVTDNTTVSNGTVGLNVTSVAGSNSNNKFYSNSISGAITGISLSGFGGVSPFPFVDTNNDVGGNSLSTGNTILNFGGAPLSTGKANGINTLAQYNANISYNTINNNNGQGANHSGDLYGISVVVSDGGVNATINHNTVTVSSSSKGASLCGINLGKFTSNLVQGGSIIANYNVVIANNLEFIEDGFNRANGTTTGIRANLLCTNVNLNNNSVDITSATSKTGSVGITADGFVTAFANINNNTVSLKNTYDFTLATLIGMSFNIDSSAGALSISGNAINALEYASANGGFTGAKAVGMSNYGTSLTLVVSNNTFNNLNIKTPDDIDLIYLGSKIGRAHV